MGKKVMNGEEYADFLRVTRKPCKYFNKDFKFCNLKVTITSIEDCSKCKNYKAGDKNV